MSVGVMKDCKLKLSDLRASHTLGWSWNWNTLKIIPCDNAFPRLIFFLADNLRELKMYICDSMSVGVMKDYKRKLRNLHVSHTLTHMLFIMNR